MRQNTVVIHPGFSVLLLVLLFVLANVFTSETFAADPTDADYGWEAETNYWESGGETNVDDQGYVKEEYSEEYGDQPEDRGGEYDSVPSDMHEESAPPKPHEPPPPPPPPPSPPPPVLPR